MKLPKKKRIPLRKSTCCMLLIILGMGVCNLLAWWCTPFADWYTDTIFPWISRIFSNVFGWIPFSVGEILIAIFILIVLFGIISYPICMLCKKGNRRRISFCYGRIFGWILTAILVTETCNCFILYHATPWGERYYTESTYTGQDLLALYESLVDTANALSTQVQRDADGYFQLQDDLTETAHAALQKLGETYPQFQGSYPLPKAIRASYLMSQMNLTGIYFPFTLEANYNDDMLDINLPDTICHELIHLRGRIREDEAGFLAYLACINSDSIDFQYSGTITALEYVQNAINSRNITGADAVADTLCAAVKQDMYAFLPDDYWAEKEETVPVLIATETVREASDTAMDTSLKLNGVDDGVQSYSRMVTLLLDDFFDTTS